MRRYRFKASLTLAAETIEDAMSTMDALMESVDWDQHNLIEIDITQIHEGSEIQTH